MGGGYGWFVFGWNEAEREQRRRERVAEFNERWNRLTNIHGQINNNFVEPALTHLHDLTPTEQERLLKYISMADAYYQHINSNINDVGWGVLGKYAAELKKLAMKSSRILAKYERDGSFPQLEYNPRLKRIMVGESIHWDLG